MSAPDSEEITDQQIAEQILQGHYAYAVRINPSPRSILSIEYTPSAVRGA